MGNSFGRWARAALLVAVIALAAMSIVTSQGIGPTVAFAGPMASNGNGNDNNGDTTSDDNNEERQLEGQVIELHTDTKPPQALVATLGENVWANLYDDQLHRSGVRNGDHVKMQGEYNGTTKGVFDAYQVDVQDRCCPGPNNNNNGNANSNDNS
jgi:hypothetical protein